MYSSIRIKAYCRYVKLLLSEGVTFTVTNGVLQGKGFYLGAELPINLPSGIGSNKWGLNLFDFS